MSSVVDEGPDAHLVSFLPKVNPGVPFHDEGRAPRGPLARSVIAYRVEPGSPALVIHCFVPFSLFIALELRRGLMPLASLPALASVRPKATRLLPEATSGRNFFFCSSDP